MSVVVLAAQRLDFTLPLFIFKILCSQGQKLTHSHGKGQATKRFICKCIYAWWSTALLTKIICMHMFRKICNALIEYSFRILILETGHSTWRRGRRVVVMDLAWIFRLLNIS